VFYYLLKQDGKTFGERHQTLPKQATFTTVTWHSMRLGQLEKSQSMNE